MKMVRGFLALVAVVLTLGLSQPSAVAQMKSGASAMSAPAPSGKLVDINSASKDELKALPGIGDVYAGRILTGRPYANKTQLLSKGILPKSTYEKVASMIIAKQK